ncbi:MAG TPA: asparagine synthase-related protein [Vicinamibacterales bacterium]|jgi:asparagine synthase (glutamine-hydrolysing)|nr:asparagine synthase-related protein [Vicinamibacterales bacterium]
MAFQAGVLFFDGRPTDNDRRVLLAAGEELAPDGVSAFTQNGLATVYGAFHVWTGDRSAQQPWRSPAGTVITWDGRLDNREELLLRVGRSLPASPGDVQIASAIFERDGVDGLRWLIGDWSLVIWDPHQRQLHLARDYMGVRPLYYYRDIGSIAWSSSLGELAVRTGQVDRLNETFVAQFMTLRLSTEATPYDGIQAMPTATCVTCSAAATERRQRFWHLEPETIRFRNRCSYEERLRELWRDAVSARLRTDGTVWAELSGGLDSSSVVCMADRLIRNRQVLAPAVQPVSYVSNRSPEGDERRFIAAVEEQIGVKSDILTVEEFQDLTDDDSEWVTPLAMRGISLACVKQVHNGSGKVILSGRMGDVVMGCVSDNSVCVWEHIERARLLRAIGEMRQWSRACRKPLIEITRNVLKDGIRGWIVGEDEEALGAPQRAGLELLSARLRSAAQQTLTRGTRLRIHPARQRLATLVFRYSVGAQLGTPTPPDGVVFTYPFAHRPLIEYMIAIPGMELSAPGETRSLMRRAFSGFLPAKVHQRFSKGNYPPAAARAMRQIAASYLPVDKLGVVRRGWIDGDRLKAAIRQLADGGGGTTGELQRVFRLEQWLTSRDRRAPAVIPTGKEVKTNGVLIA